MMKMASNDTKVTGLTANNTASAVLTEAELDAQRLAEEKQQAKDDAFFDAKGDSDSESEESVDLTLQFD
jgi:hypothetical protein